MLKRKYLFEVRDRRYRNTFLVDERGKIFKILFPVGHDTVHQIGDIIDFNDHNIYIPHQGRLEMEKTRRGRKIIKEVHNFRRC